MTPEPEKSQSFVRGLGFWDSCMIVAGSMIGSGIFIVSADIARLTGSPGGLLAAWVITGVLTIIGALSYGELAAMMPQAGGLYVYLREAFSPLFGFLYGWTVFLIIQAGSIAALGIAFARFLGVLFPEAMSPNIWIVEPIHLSDGYALSLSRQQLVGVLMIAFLTWINTRGLAPAKMIQNLFTVAKILGLAALIVLGLSVCIDPAAARANFSDLWTPRDPVTMRPGLAFLPALTVGSGAMALIVAFCVAQVGSLFSADAWYNVTYVAGEVREPKRNVPLSMAVGAILVIVLYLLANVAYLTTLPFEAIQNAPDDRVGTAALSAKFGGWGASLMAIVIAISVFGCNNGLVLAGARVYYSMAKDGLFFRPVAKLNARHVPAVALVLQGIWSVFLVLPRTRSIDAGGREVYGNLYSDLLDYVIFAVLLFLSLTILGLFVLRKKRPDLERPYRAFGYPVLPALYVVFAAVIMLALIGYKTQMTWPGLLIVLTGIPVYFGWRRGASATRPQVTS